MKKAFRILSLLATGLAVVGCQDFENGFSAQEIKNAEYAAHFEKVFGTPDPNQDWSMATLVKANVNLPGLTDTAKMNICTGDPRNSETRLLAQIMLKDGKGSIDFDAIKGSENVFVTVEQDGEYKIYAEFNVSNGFLAIGDVQMPLTRGGSGSVVEKSAFSDACPTKQETDADGKFVVHSASEISFTGKFATQIKYGTDTRSYDEWKSILAGSNVNQNYNPTPWTDASVFLWKHSYANFDDAVLMDKAVDNGDGTITYNYGDGINWNNFVTRTIQEWKNEYNKSNYSTKEPWTGVTWVEDELCNMTDLGATYAGKQTDETKWVEKEGVTKGYPTLNTQFQYLKNVEQVPSDPWTTSLGYSLFGDDAFFAETVPYFNSKKLGVFYNEDEMAQMENGYSILTTGGQIELPYIFGVTSYADIFGYIYYKEEDADNVDPLALKHFVLIEDARPSENIFRINADGTETAVKGTSNGSASDFADYTGAIGGENQSTEGNKQTRGTVYSPMFFGENYDQEKGTYDWPSGYRIIFFIDKVGNDASNASVTAHDNQKQYNFAYSLPELNLRLGKKYQNAGSYPAKADQGQVKCITWTRDGVTYMGFGDNSGDNDLNDIVIVVAGAFEHGEPPVKVAPIYWHNNFDGKHHDGNNTTTKNDDLYFEQSLNDGATYGAPSGTPKDPSGRTFLGWATEPDGTPVAPSEFGTKTVSGTDPVCYFAIWEPAGETVKIKWHTNVTTPGAHKTDDSDLLPNSTLTLAPGDSYVQPTTPPTRDGYTFMGWSTDPTADPDGTFPAIDTTAGDEDVCYFAIWKQNITPDTDPEPASWIFACEDLGGSFDYDFNDVVWEVIHAAGTTELKVKLLAAGGTLPFELQYDGTKITTKSEAGLENGTVYEGPLSKEYTLSAVEETWTVLANKDKFKVLVGNETSGIATVYAKNGEKTPQVIVLPSEWEWPTEGTLITDAYTNFTNWVSNGRPVKWSDWSAAKKSGKTVSRSATHN